MREDRATGRNVGRAGIYHPDGWPEPELGWMIYAGTDEGRGLAREAATAAREGAALLKGFQQGGQAPHQLRQGQLPMGLIEQVFPLESHRHRLVTHLLPKLFAPGLDALSEQLPLQG